MDSGALNRFLAVNRHLAALSEAGVPLALGDASRPVGPMMDQVNGAIALEVGRGQSLPQALAHATGLPGSYRSALLTALASDDLSNAPKILDRASAAKQRVREVAGKTLLAPLIVLALTYLAFIFLCVYVSPTFEALYAQLGEQGSLPIRFLAASRSTMAIWGPLVPLAIAIFIWHRRRGAVSPALDAIPALRRCRIAAERASFAKGLDSLLENGIPLPEAIQLTADVSTSKKLADAAGRLIADDQGRADSHSPVAAARSLPPLLGWAIADRDNQERLRANLQFAAEAYSRAATQQAARCRRIIPTVIGSLLCGAIVLAYGLSLFTPMVRLLERLAQPF